MAPFHATPRKNQPRHRRTRRTQARCHFQTHRGATRKEKPRRWQQRWGAAAVRRREGALRGCYSTPPRCRLSTRTATASTTAVSTTISTTTFGRAARRRLARAAPPKGPSGRSPRSCCPRRCGSLLGSCSPPRGSSSLPPPRSPRCQLRPRASPRPPPRPKTRRRSRRRARGATPERCSRSEIRRCALPPPDRLPGQFATTAATGRCAPTGRDSTVCRARRCERSGSAGAVPRPPRSPACTLRGTRARCPAAHPLRAQPAPRP